MGSTIPRYTMRRRAQNAPALWKEMTRRKQESTIPQIQDEEKARCKTLMHLRAQQREGIPRYTMKTKRGVKRSCNPKGNDQKGGVDDRQIRNTRQGINRSCNPKGNDQKAGVENCGIMKTRQGVKRAGTWTYGKWKGNCASNSTFMGQCCYF